MNMEVLSWILNGVLGVCMYLLKTEHNNIKAEIKENKEDIKKVREESFKTDEFLRFTNELWKRFDRLEDRVNAKLL